MTTTQKIKQALAEQWLAANDAALTELVAAVQELLEDGDTIEEAIEAVIDGVVWGYIQHQGIGKRDASLSYTKDVNGDLHFACGVDALAVNGGRFIMWWPTDWRNDCGDYMRNYEVRGIDAAVAAVERTLAWQ